MPIRPARDAQEREVKQEEEGARDTRPTRSRDWEEGVKGEKDLIVREMRKRRWALEANDSGLTRSEGEWSSGPIARTVSGERGSNPWPLTWSGGEAARVSSGHGAPARHRIVPPSA